MFIRRTTIKSRNPIAPVSPTACVKASERVGGKVKQRTLLNLGRHFANPREQWPELSARIEQLLNRRRGKNALLELELIEDLERQAQRYVALIVAT